MRILPLLLSLSFLALINSCSKDHAHQAEGYIEGRYTYIATNVPGRLKEIKVLRGTKVNQDQELLVLDPEPETEIFTAAQAKVEQSEAARNAILANVDYTKLMLDRYQKLVPNNAAQKSQLDNARTQYNKSKAQLAEANAAIENAKANLASTRWTKDQKIIKSPADAIVFDTYYRVGELTIINQPIISLLSPKDIKAIFFIREIDLGKIKLRDHVQVNCNGCQQNIEAAISFISPTAEFTPPVIYDNKTNPKLIYRIEADFTTEDAWKLHPGQPITITYLKS